ncbi:MAG: conserved exported protein of unknown function [Nitrospira sp.]|nr:MAG: conserved exported protein of unknown function [Nitrospira sp.]
MYKTVAIMAVSYIIWLSCLSPAGADTLSVETFNYPPNYALSTDPDDIRQLTDGRLAPFPIWTSKQTVGWAALTPIAIRLRVVKVGANPGVQAGTIRVHSAKGLSAGVDIPKHIDIYTQIPNGHFQLVGSADPNSDALADKQAHWLAIPVSAATDTLVVVLHAAGDYLFLDELEWRPAGTGQVPTVASLPNISAILTDSTRRTRDTLIRAIETEIGRATIPLEASAMHVWLEDPWGTIEPKRARERVGAALPALRIQGYAGEHESLCLGVVAGREASGSGLWPTVTGIPSEAIRLFEVRPVMAASGQRVYDPLLPLNSTARIALHPGEPVYLWLDINLATLGPGIHRWTLRLEGASQTLLIDGTATVMEYDRANLKPLNAVNWAYLSDLPILRQRDAATRDLAAHGINTFVAHPSDIPGLPLDGRWDTAQEARLAHTIAMAKQSGTLLLYLGWAANKNPVGYSSTHPAIDPAASARLLAWVETLDTYLTRQGLSRKQWALYPVDEPNLPGLRLLRVIADAVKRRHPTIQIYANLSAFADPPVRTSDLEDVRPLVDYWQPSLAVVRGPLGSWFTMLQRDWWLYSNPKSPAKLASPLHDFRLLAWWAWYYGAKGIGFWSYSDTSGSSAWDDLDSRRPDWAVVYESPDGIVSSRRWEAFREGLEDYALLTTRLTTKERIQRIGKSNFDQWNTSDIESVRQALLRDPSLSPPTRAVAP